MVDAVPKKYILKKVSPNAALVTVRVFKDDKIILQYDCNYVNSTLGRRNLQNILTEDEYNSIINVWGDTLTIPDKLIPENQLELRRKKKIAVMSEKCREQILKGFDCVLDDGEIHHFSLEIEDQLKIQALGLKAKSGETILPYHADGENCRFFTPEEILKLNVLMEQIIESNTTYFNSLKNYINHITTENEINSIYFGIDIPKEYQSEVLIASHEKK